MGGKKFQRKAGILVLVLALICSNLLVLATDGKGSILETLGVEKTLEEQSTEATLQETAEEENSEVVLETSEEVLEESEEVLEESEEIEESREILVRSQETSEENSGRTVKENNTSLVVEPGTITMMEVDDTYRMICPGNVTNSYMFKFIPKENAGYYLDFRNDLGWETDMGLECQVLDEEDNLLAGGVGYFMLEAGKQYTFQVSAYSQLTAGRSVGELTMRRYCDWDACVYVTNGIATGLSEQFRIVHLPDGVTGMENSGSIELMGIHTLILPTSIQTSVSNRDFWKASYRYITLGNEGRYHAEDGILYDQIERILRYVPYIREGSYSVKEGTTGIGSGAFGATKLEEIIIPDSVEYLEDSVFGKNETIKRIKLPANASGIEASQFYALFALESLEISSNSLEYETRDGVLFKKNYDEKWTLVYYPIGKNLVSYTVPDDVTELGQASFARAMKSGVEENPVRNLKFITIPATVERLDWCLSAVGNYTSFPEMTLRGYLNSAAYEYWEKNFSLSTDIHWETIGEEDPYTAFILGRDNNSFCHFSDLDPKSGFYGVNKYWIDEKDYETLFNHKMNDGTRDYVRELINGENKWSGSCYGIATVLGLVYNENIDISEISELGAPTIYTMLKPCEDLDYLSTINYYQLMQHIYSPRDYGTSIVEANLKDILYNNIYELIQGNLGASQEKDIQELFYVMLENLQERQSVLLLVPGHTVMVTGYDKTESGYSFQVYDENSVKSDTPEGVFYELKTNHDFTTFECEELGINTDHYGEVIVMVPSEVDQKDMMEPQDGELAKIITYLSDPFELVDSTGKVLKNMVDDIENTMEIEDIQLNSETLENENGEKTISSECMFTVADGESYEWTPSGEDTDVIIYNSQGYLSLHGTNIISANITPGEGISMKGGENCSFTIVIDTDEIVAENETGLVEILGTITNGIVEIQTSGEIVTVTADKDIDDLILNSYIKNQTRLLDTEDMLEGGNKLEIHATDFSDGNPGPEESEPSDPEESSAEIPSTEESSPEESSAEIPSTEESSTKESSPEESSVEESSVEVSSDGTQNSESIMENDENEGKETDADEQAPGTGDRYRSGYFVITFLLSAIAIGIIMKLRKRKMKE